MSAVAAILQLMQRKEERRERREKKRDKKMRKHYDTMVKALTGKDDSVPPPRKMDKDEDIVQYLDGFESTMIARGTPKLKWPAAIRPLLSKKFDATLASMPAADKDSWDTLKDALIHTESEENLQAPLNFFSSNKRQGETFLQYCTRLQRYFAKMTATKPKTPASQELALHVVIERFIETLPFQAQAYLHERGPATINQACAQAEEYFSHHRLSVANYLGHGQFYQNSGGFYRQSHRQQQPWKQQQQQPPPATPPPQQQQQHGQPAGGAQPYKPPHRRGKCSNDKKKDLSGVLCYRCGEMGHYSSQCKAQVRVNFIESRRVNANALSVPGKIAGKEVSDILLDTGADTSVVSHDLVPEGTKHEATVIMRSVTGTKMPCPQVTLPVEVNGSLINLSALVAPRRMLQRDTLLGTDCPGLVVQWSVGNGKVPEPKPVRGSDQEHSTDGAQWSPKGETGGSPEVPVAPESLEGVDQKTGSEVEVDILTRAQVNREGEELKQLEALDLQSEATPTPLGGYDIPTQDDGQEAQGWDDLSPLMHLTPVLDGSETTVSRETLVAQQKGDSTLKHLWQKAESQDPAGYKIDRSGMLVKVATNHFGEEVNLIVVPKQQRFRTFQAAHVSNIGTSRDKVHLRQAGRILHMARYVPRRQGLVLPMCPVPEAQPSEAEHCPIAAITSGSRTMGLDSHGYSGSLSQDREGTQVYPHLCRSCH